MSSEFSCQEMAEVVTTYLDGASPPDDRERFERHLSYCAGCGTYVDQMREVIRQTGEVQHGEPLPPALRAGLAARFRAWKRDQETPPA